MHKQPGKQKPSSAGSSDKDQEQVGQHTGGDEKIKEREGDDEEMKVKKPPTKREEMEPVLKSRVDHGVYRWQRARGDAVPG